MANPKTPTSTNSSSNIIRNSVQAVLQQNKDQTIQNATRFQTISNTTLRDSRAITAAAAMYRATTSSFKPSDEQKRDYYAAASKIAELQGIKPDNDGNFSDEQYKNELSPENILRAYSGSITHDNGEQAFETFIKPAIQSAYTDKENNEDVAVTPPSAIMEIGNISLKTDEDFLGLSEDEQDKYLASIGDFEKERLTKERNKAKESYKTKNAGEFKGFTNDPDFGNKDDEDLKIDSGDIIDYLMKEVLLKGASWTLDKFIASPAGIIVYETVHGIHYGITKPAKEKSLEKVTSCWDSFLNIFRTKDKNQTSEEQKANEERTVLFKNLSANYIERIDDINKHINYYTSNDWELLSKKQRLLAKHFNIITDNGIITYNKEEKQSKTIPYKDPYNKENLTKIQENIDNEQIKTINERLNPQNNPETRKKIEDQYKKAVETIHQSVRDGKEHTITDGEVEGFAKAFEYAQTKSIHKIEHTPAIETIFAQQALFASHYSQFILSQELLKNPHTFDNEQNVAELSVKSNEEAAKIFADVYTGKNNPRSISCEALVAEAASLVEKSKNGKPVENTIEATYSPKQNRGDVAFSEAFNNMTLEEMYTKQLINLERRETELTAQQQTTDNVRNRINQIKQQIKTPNNEELKKFKVGDIRTKNTERTN